MLLKEEINAKVIASQFRETGFVIERIPLHRTGAWNYKSGKIENREKA